MTERLADQNRVERRNHVDVDAIQEFFEHRHTESGGAPAYAERYARGKFRPHLHLSGSAGCSLGKLQDRDLCVLVEPTAVGAGRDGVIRKDHLSPASDESEPKPHIGWEGSTRNEISVLVLVGVGCENCQRMIVRVLPSVIRLTTVDDCQGLRADPAHHATATADVALSLPPIGRLISVDGEADLAPLVHVGLRRVPRGECGHDVIKSASHVVYCIPGHERPVGWEQWRRFVNDNIELPRVAALLTSRSESILLYPLLDFQVKGVEVLR